MSKAKLDELQASFQHCTLYCRKYSILIYRRSGSGVHVAIVFYRQSRNILPSTRKMAMLLVSLAGFNH
ncbi:hypothetical protein T03_360 [Trichinella britovi]|uniref:Uncharacterized protein n=1 Tax=Trichinella britovi TaxID=45882 RepID=A0A0V1AN84_TRIBR|nr:hypothetical protein T03_360 [Trichinella britovi]